MLARTDVSIIATMAVWRTDQFVVLGLFEEVSLAGNVWQGEVVLYTRGCELCDRDGTIGKVSTSGGRMVGCWHDQRFSNPVSQVGNDVMEVAAVPINKVAAVFFILHVHIP
jgi:hypothetical protein